MSSEALREAFVWLEAIASADPKLVRPSGLAAALLAEVARLEQERDDLEGELADFGESRPGRLARAEAALAVAREREQRATDALRVLMSYARNVDIQAAEVQGGADFRAALVDEPAAAMLVGNHPKRPGDDTVDLAEAVDAAADEPGETPAKRDGYSREEAWRDGY